MALATQCPHCQTTFRVAHDQLKLRAGLVRCGYCKEIFNGIENLLPSEDATPPVTPAPVASDTPVVEATAPAVTESATAPIQTSDETDEVAASEEAIIATPPASKIDFDIPAGFERDADIHTAISTYEENKPEDPLQRMTLLDFTRDLPDEITAETAQSTYDPHAPDELDEAMKDLQRRPWRGSKKSARAEEHDALDEVDAEDEPSFLKHGRQRQRLSRKLRIFLSIGSFILLIAALAQSTYVFRNQIAGWFPDIKPILTQMCSMLDCRIDLPAQIDQVSIESSELQTLATNKDTFVLTTLLRNYSSTPQEWPHIELTLNDTNEKPLLRRVFNPSDYLSSAEDMRLGFASRSERSVKLSFELAQIKASGYRVYLFYP